MGRGSLDTWVVVGAGLPRTGTLSTRVALELLLGGPCYHGAVPLVEQKHHQQVWREVFETGSIEPVVQSGILEGYRAGVDHPIMCWYQDILALHPSVKVLLTVRDPKGWFASIKWLDTQMKTLTSTFPYPWFFKLVGMGKDNDYARECIQGVNHGVLGKLNEALKDGEDKSIEFFKAHIEEVKSLVPNDQLLVFDVREGWEPLCKFLDLPIPSVPFPNINDRKQMQTTITMLRCVAWVVVVVLPILASCAAYWYSGSLGMGDTIIFVLLVGGLIGLGAITVRMVIGKHMEQKIK